MTSAATVGTDPHTINELGKIASTQDTISLSWTNNGLGMSKWLHPLFHEEKLIHTKAQMSNYTTPIYMDLLTYPWRFMPYSWYWIR